MALSAPSGWTYGCKHYKRSCKLLAPCCNEVVSCRFCHDDVKDHQLQRFQVKEIICNRCATKQGVSKKCKNCGIRFGLYVCLICKLFDHEDKEQFHCFDCGICRIGGKQNYFHCPKCNFCFAWRLYNNHTCVENVSHSNCPVCLEDMHHSRTAPHVPPCGHLLHQKCYDKLKTEFKECIVCKKPY